MENEIKNLIILSSSVAASLCYSYFFTTKLPKGIYRLLSLLPVFSLFTILPLSLSYALTSVTATGFITWLANSKLLLFAFDQGPLYPPTSLVIFVTTAAFPIKIKQKKDHKSSTMNKKTLPLNFPMEVLGFVILMSVLLDYREKLHPMIIMLVYSCILFLLLDILMTAFHTGIRILVGVEIEVVSDEPYLAKSLQEFWGSRWNLMVTHTLRHTVYKPVSSASAAVLGKWGPLAGVFAAFIVSGLMHELLVFYISREDPTWEMTSFFVLHGFCVVVELVVKKALKGNWRLPWYVAQPLTVGFVVATGFWLFFPPLIRTGVDMKFIQEYVNVMNFTKTKLKLN